jgi:hypothetical protein
LHVPVCILSQPHCRSCQLSLKHHGEPEQHQAVVFQELDVPCYSEGHRHCLLRVRLGRVRPVRFFIIEVDYQGIKAIKNVLEGSPSDHCANSRTCIFALAGGEAVKRVDVYYSKSCVTGLWFHTNKRASHRIGRFAEYEDRLRVPKGFCLHSFAGKSGYVGYFRHIIRLSALLSPLPEASVHDVPRGILTYPQRTGCASEDMRAILVKITNGLEGIYALSARDVAALLFSRVSKNQALL